MRRSNFVSMLDECKTLTKHIHFLNLKINQESKESENILALVYIKYLNLK